MPFIEVKTGGVDIPEGVYPVILSDISDPRVITAQTGPKAGQEMELLDWTFVIESGEYENTELSVSTSMASGPRSKMYAFLTALFGGKAPPIGTQLEKADIIGRSALATVQLDDRGWMRITNLGAPPANYIGGTNNQSTVSQPADDAVPARPTPLRDTVEAGADRKLPF